MKKYGIIVIVLAIIATGGYYFQQSYGIDAAEIEKQIVEIKKKNNLADLNAYFQENIAKIRQSKNALAKAAFEYHRGVYNFEKYQKMEKMQNPLMDMTIYRNIRMPIQNARLALAHKITKDPDYRFQYARLDQLINQLDNYRNTKLSFSAKAELELRKMMTIQNDQRANPRRKESHSQPLIKQPVPKPNEFIQNQKIPQRAKTEETKVVR